MKFPSRIFAVPFETFVALGVAVAAAGCGSSSSNDNGDGGSSTPDSGNGQDSSGNDANNSSSDDGGGADASDAGTTGVIAVPLASCIPLVYAANVAIGSQQFQLLVDTGSSSLGVAGSACTTCGVTPLYSPGSSAVDQKTTGTEQFGSGSWSGEIYQDNVGFENDPAVPVDFIDVATQTGFFQAGASCGGQPYQGLMGFDRAAAAITGTDVFFDQFVAARGIANIFATQLCDNGGTLWLGGYDPSATTAAPQYTPFTSDVASPDYYTVNLASISVGGTTTTVPLSAELDDAILDTGTSAMIVDPTAFTGIAAAIGGTAGFQTIFGADSGTGWFANQSTTAQPSCANLTQTKAELDSTLPTLSLTFGSGAAAITVQAVATESYLVPNPNGAGWCNSLLPAPADIPVAALLGSPFLRSNVVIFDRAGGRVGFAPHQPCTGTN